MKISEGWSDDMKCLDVKPQIVWCVFWSDTHCVVDGLEPDFLHSIHGSRKGDVAEMRSQRMAKHEILP